jgi:pimeloyl-ACP methyl ester carboxylesterase
LRLATKSWGEEGRPLAVLVHGVNASSLTWWRVGPWFAENGWRAVAVDLRGQGASPRMRGGERLEDLTEDVYETVFEAPGTNGADVLLGHSLGALISLELYRGHGEPAWRMVLEEPPGSESTDFEEVAREVEADAALAKESPKTLARQYLDQIPSWAEEDARNSVAGLRVSDAGPVAAFLREGLRFDLAQMAGSVAVPTLLVLGSEERGSVLPDPERTAVAGPLRQVKVEGFEAGHSIHRDDFEGYVGFLGGWLGEPKS